MSDHTGPDAPIRRPQTCEQKHDATIADLAARVDALEIVPKFELYGMLEIVDEINSLRERVATLETQQAAQKPTYYTATPDGPGFVHSPGYPQEDAEPPDGSAYSFQDDNRPTPVKSQRGECPIVVRVPVAGDVDSATGDVSWRKGWHARGWTKVAP
jgi:hypothetical protein